PDPMVTIEIPSPDQTSCSLKDIYERLLMAMNEPCITNKIEYPQENERRERWIAGPRATTAAMRMALENSLRIWKPTAVILDEAQHLLTKAGSKAYQQMDLIK